MSKKTILFVILIFSSCCLLTGCWNYRGLNELSIVSGVAIDRDRKTGLYELTFEIIDLSTSSKEGSVKANLVESEGRTIFDAVRNAKKRLSNKLYMGNAQIVVISHQIASEDGISNVMDFFLQDAETRETLVLLISQEETARDILVLEGVDNPDIALEIKQIIDEDNKTVSTTKNEQFYQAYDTLRSEGISLSVACIRKVSNNGEDVAEVNGMAIFHGDHMIGYLTPEETKYYLLVVNDVEGGIITINAEGKTDQNDNISFEISENHSKIDYMMQDGKPKMMIKTNTNVYLGEAQVPIDFMSMKNMEELEKMAEDKVKDNVEDLIQKVQSQYRSDIFGFGNSIYKKNPKQWNQLKDNWDQLFPDLEVEVQSKVQILNTAGTRKSGR